MSEQNFIILGQLGKGTFGTVYKARRKLDGKIYALKKVKLLGLKNKQVENALKEARFLSTLSHPNIVSYKEAFLDQKQQNLFLVLQFADKGDVQSKLKEYKGKRRRYTEAEIWRAVEQIGAGLAYLHQQQVMHRDLKAANIFIFHGQEGNNYKIGDFNVSKLLVNQMAETQTGTPYYCSPEVWKDQPYNFKSDIYSLGCLIYEMCTQSPPFQAKTLEELFHKVMRGAVPSLTKYSAQLNNLVKKCMNITPKLRPTATEIANSVFKKLQNEDERPRAKSIGVTPHHDMLRTVYIKNRGTFNLRIALPAPRYETPAPSSERAQHGRVRFNEDNVLKLPRLSTEREGDSCKTEKSSKSRPKSNKIERHNQESYVLRK